MDSQKNTIRAAIQLSTKASFVPSSTKSNKRSTTSIPTFAKTINQEFISDIVLHPENRVEKLYKQDLSQTYSQHPRTAELVTIVTRR